MPTFPKKEKGELKAFCKSLTLVITFANCPRRVRAFDVRAAFDVDEGIILQGGSH